MVSRIVLSHRYLVHNSQCLASCLSCAGTLATRSLQSFLCPRLFVSWFVRKLPVPHASLVSHRGCIQRNAFGTGCHELRKLSYALSWRTS